MLRQHGSADGLANAMAVCVANASALSEPNDQSHGRPIAHAFGKPDWKSIDIAEPVAYMVSDEEPVSIPKCQSVHNSSVTVAIDVSKPGAELEPEHEPQRISLARAITQPFDVAKLRAVTDADWKPVAISERESLFDS